MSPTQRAIVKILVRSSQLLEEADWIHHQGADRQAWPGVNAALIASITGAPLEEVREALV